ncbi:MAG: hypothetical protein Rubg2KO_31070 [Rubricoccaceae bacterium]
MLRSKKAESMPDPAVHEGDGAAPEVEDTPEAPPAAQPAAAHQPEAEEGGNVDKIRDILFGRQMVDYDGRFAKLEEKLTREASALRDEVRSRMDTLDGYVRQEIETLTRKIETEKRERIDAVGDITREVRSDRERFAQRVDEIGAGTEEDVRNVRQQLLDEASRIRESLQSKADDLVRSLDQHVDTLQDQKADRRALAEMLADVAARLHDG